MEPGGRQADGAPPPPKNLPSLIVMDTAEQSINIRNTTTEKRHFFIINLPFGREDRPSNFGLTLGILMTFITGGQYRNANNLQNILSFSSFGNRVTLADGVS